MQLAKIRVLFLSPSFYPQSPASSYWEMVHTHVPPATFSGIVLRAVLSAFSPRHIYGDYIPCEIGKGLLVQVSKRGDNEVGGVSWTKAGKAEKVAGYKPPYTEYHFRAVSFGAYPLSVLKGGSPKVGIVDKFWNVIKYIDVREENLLAPITIGIKTWHYTVLDGTSIEKRRHQTYEVVKVRHVVYLDEVYGFVLVDDPVVANALRRLEEGWFIIKTRLKTLVALRVEELMEQVSRVDKVDYLVPMLTKPTKPTYSFTTAILDLDALSDRRVDVSVVKGYLHTTSEPEIERLMLFRSRDGAVYGVDPEWLRYMESGGSV